MNDLALRWDPLQGGADFEVEANDLASDDTLETAVLLSLFTDRRVEGLETSDPHDRRGWWADELSPIDGDKHGSRLWLLSREKQEPQVLERAREYALEALQWMLDDQLAERLEVVAEVLRAGVLLLTVTLYRPKVDPASFKYDYNWAAQEARRA